jgi:hypothetical protein
MKVSLEEGLAPIVGDVAHKVKNYLLTSTQSTIANYMDRWFQMQRWESIESPATLLNELGDIFSKKDSGSPQLEPLSAALKRYALP